MDLARNLSVNF